MKCCKSENLCIYITIIIIIIIIIITKITIHRSYKLYCGHKYYFIAWYLASEFAFFLSVMGDIMLVTSKLLGLIENHNIIKTKQYTFIN